MNTLAKLGCKVFGHHPWVGTGVSFGPPEDDEETPGDVVVTVRTDYGACKRCGSHDSVKHNVSIRRWVVQQTIERVQVKVFAHEDNGSIEVRP